MENPAQAELGRGTRWLLFVGFLQGRRLNDGILRLGFAGHHGSFFLDGPEVPVGGDEGLWRAAQARFDARIRAFDVRDAFPVKLAERLLDQGR